MKQSNFETSLREGPEYFHRSNTEILATIQLGPPQTEFEKETQFLPKGGNPITGDFHRAGTSFCYHAYWSYLDNYLSYWHAPSALKRWKNGFSFQGQGKDCAERASAMHASGHRGRIMEEVKSAKFQAIQADETDVSTQTQLVLVERYFNVNHAVQKFSPCYGCNVYFNFQCASGQTECDEGRAGRCATKGAHLNNAHYVLCYAHQLDNAVSHHSRPSCESFLYWSGRSGFFSTSFLPGHASAPAFLTS